jgi:hypothetical protein
MDKIALAYIQILFEQVFVVTATPCPVRPVTVTLELFAES